MNKAKSVTNITDEQLKSVTNRLKNYYAKWIQKMVEFVNKDPRWKSYSAAECTPSKLRAISDGSVKNQMARAIFLTHASRLIKEGEMAVSEAMAEMEKSDS